MRTSEQQKRHLVREIRQLAKTEYEGKRIEGACLYWADLTCRVLNQKGFRAIVQAGSASWPIIRLPEDDDGVCNTHFSYEWHGVSSKALERFMRDSWLPEMHVWAGIPDRQELIDLTTCYVPVQAESMGVCTRENWRGPTYDYIWTHRLPKNVRYEPNRDATELAMAILNNRPLMLKLI